MPKKRDFKQARKSERKVNEATHEAAREAATGKRKSSRTPASADEFVRKKLKEIFPDVASRRFFEQLGKASEQGPEFVYRISMTQALICSKALNQYLKTADSDEALKEIRDMTTIINRLLQSSLQASKLDYEFNLGAHPDRIEVSWNAWDELDKIIGAEDLH